MHRSTDPLSRVHGSPGTAAPPSPKWPSGSTRLDAVGTKDMHRVAAMIVSKHRCPYIGLVPRYANGLPVHRRPFHAFHPTEVPDHGPAHHGFHCRGGDLPQALRTA